MQYPSQTLTRQASPLTPGSRVSLQAVAKRFGNQMVLRQISLEIQPGEFVAVVGKSGCGKSTLLRLLAGLEAPSQGTVLIEGQALQGLNPQARVMFQDSRLLPWRRVLDNVALGLGRQGRSRGHWALQQVGLDSRSKNWTTQLSGGQQQRVALARALVRQPQLLLLDEPLGALDALTRLEMQRLIEQLWQEQGFTAVLVTHDVEEAVMLADRVIVVKAGEIAADIPVALPRPRDSTTSEVSHLKRQVLQHILTTA